MLHKSMLNLLVSITVATTLAAPMAQARISNAAASVPSDMFENVSSKQGGEPQQRSEPRQAPQRSEPVQRYEPVQRAAPVERPQAQQRQIERPAAPPQREVRAPAPAAPIRNEIPRPEAQRQEPQRQNLNVPAPRPQEPTRLDAKTDPRSLDKNPKAQEPVQPVKTSGGLFGRKAPEVPAPVAPTAPTRKESENIRPIAPPTQPAAKPVAQENRPAALARRTPPPPGVSDHTMSAREAKIEAPKAPTAALKAPPTKNKDNSVTEHYTDGSSIRKDPTTGRVLSQYDAQTHKTVYTNKDQSVTIAHGSQSVRTFTDGTKVIKNAKTHEVSTYNPNKQTTVTVSPGKRVTLDHNTGIVNVEQGRVHYSQTPTNNGYVRSVSVNGRPPVDRIYVYQTNIYGGNVLFYTPTIYSHPYYSYYTNGLYGGYGYAGVGYYVNPWNYGWSIWNQPAQMCWWGNCRYVGYSPFSPYTWNDDYGYYYSPIVAISSPVDYLVATVIAESMENRRQERLERARQLEQDRIDRQNEINEAAAQDLADAEVLKKQADEELAEAQALQAKSVSITVPEDAKPTMNAEALAAQKTTVDHVSAELSQKPDHIDVIKFLTSDKGAHGFELHDTINVGEVDPSDLTCTLGEGDTIEVKPGTQVTTDSTNIPMKVLSALPGDCMPATIVNVSLSQLQQMLNATVEKVTDAMADMATKKMGQQK